VEEFYKCRREENYRKPRKFLKMNAEKAMYKYFDIIRNEIMEIKRT
jgi:hypothetical protein